MNGMREAAVVIEFLLGAPEGIHHSMVAHMYYIYI